MKSKITVAAGLTRGMVVALVILSLLTLQGCNKSKVQTPGDASSNWLEKTLRACDEISRGIDVGLAALPVLQDGGYIDAAEREELSQSLQGIKTPIDQFTEQARSSSTSDASEKEQLAALFAGVEAAIANFDANGVLHLKSAKAQNRAKLWSAGMKAAAGTAKRYLSQPNKQ